MSRPKDGYWYRAQQGRLLPIPRLGKRTPVRGHRSTKDIGDDPGILLMLNDGARPLNNEGGRHSTP